MPDGMGSRIFKDETLASGWLTGSYALFNDEGHNQCENSVGLGHRAGH